MSGTRSSFRELDESKKSEVALGDMKSQVKDKATVSIATSQGNAKIFARYCSCS